MQHVTEVPVAPFYHPIGLRVARGGVDLPHTPEGTQFSHQLRLELRSLVSVDLLQNFYVAEDSYL